MAEVVRPKFMQTTAATEQQENLTNLEMKSRGTSAAHRSNVGQSLGTLNAAMSAKKLGRGGRGQSA